MAILIVEDDVFWSARLSEMLIDHGVEALRASSAEEALAVPAASYDAAIIDVMLPNDPEASGISLEESRAGFLTGVALARRLRHRRPDIKIVLITSDIWSGECAQWGASQSVPVIPKSDGQRAIRAALRSMGLLGAKSGPKAFIVHGHDDEAVLQLKNYVQNTLGWPEPLVLREQPNCGKTLIEKFEDYAGQVDCAFVLLTPDDRTAGKTTRPARRSRQNVIFELGFFFAQFGRQSGRTLVLYKGPNELPSDIHGIVWIPIDNGIEAAGEQIRRELARLATGTEGAVP
jgi:predicted nucleotide-binding protein